MNMCGDTYIGLEGSVHSEEDNRPDKLGVEELGVDTFSNVWAVDLIGKFVTLGQTDISLVVLLLWVKSVRIVVFAVGHTRIKHVYIKHESIKFHYHASHLQLVARSPSAGGWFTSWAGVKENDLALV